VSLSFRFSSFSTKSGHSCFFKGTRSVGRLPPAPLSLCSPPFAFHLYSHSSRQLVKDLHEGSLLCRFEPFDASNPFFDSGEPMCGPLPVATFLFFPPLRRGGFFLIRSQIGIFLALLLGAVDGGCFSFSFQGDAPRVIALPDRPLLFLNDTIFLS